MQFGFYKYKKILSTHAIEIFLFGDATGSSGALKKHTKISQVVPISQHCFVYQAGSLSLDAR